MGRKKSVRRKTVQNQFHLGEILSVVTGRFVSGFEDISKLGSFLTGCRVNTVELALTRARYRAVLLEQFPQFGTPEMEFEVAELDRAVAGLDKKGATKAVSDWLARQVARYGDTFTVTRKTE